MADRRATNRAMFWRIIRRLLGANRGRLFVMLLALGAGAAVTAALLNLQVDAKRRLTTEFRVFGANVVITPRTGDISGPPTLDESVLQRISGASALDQTPSAGFLYAIINVTAVGLRTGLPSPMGSTPVVLVGYSTDAYHRLIPSIPLEVSQPTGWRPPFCSVGASIARQLQLHARDSLLLSANDVELECFVQTVDSYGGPEDNQIFVNLETVQNLEGLSRRISVAQVSAPGTPRDIDRFIADLQARIPEADVRGIRQFTEGEARIYNRISGLLTATVAIVLVLTGLCVMAAMTNVAMERKNDVGLMKAIGGSMRRVLRLFLAEAALLGLAGGIIGAAAGIFLSIGLGKAVFGVAARPRLIVYPVAVALTTIVAILSAYPLRRLASIRPASVFRGEA